MNIANLHLTDDNLGEIIQHLKTLPRPFEHAALSADTQFSQTFHQSSTPIQGDSYMISQGCYGLSNHQPIGTQHVGNCIAIILRDPKTNLTALIHFDAHTSPQSLEDVFALLPKDGLEAAIIGAKYAETEDPNFKGYFQDTSRSNIITVLNLLAAKSVKLTSAWIADIQQPHAFIVDPKSGQIEIGIPSLPDPEQDILFATRYLSAGLQPIALAYNLTESSDRVPMPLNTEALDFFERFWVASGQNTLEEMQEWLSSQGYRGDLNFYMGMLNHRLKTQTLPASQITAHTASAEITCQITPT